MTTKTNCALVVMVCGVLLLLSCKKKDEPDPQVQTGDTTIVKPVDPEVAKTMGFFLDQWSAKNFTAPAYTEENTSAAATVTVTVDASKVIAKISNTLYGHNANTWMTPMVTEPAFLTHTTQLAPHIIRFPAGSGSDCYFFNAKDASQLPSDVPAMLPDKDGVKKDPNYFFGRTTANWQASLDNYYSMLQQTNNVGVLTMNYGYARYGISENPVATAAHLAAEWVRYDNGRTQYWEIGNEVYADWEAGYRIDPATNKDGQPLLITGKLYAQHVKVFADSMRKAAAETGATIYIGAVMYESEPQDYQANSFKTWNATMLPELNNTADFYIGHNYFTPYNENSTAGVILTNAVTQPPAMINFMTGQMTTHGVQIKPLAMTEWNMFAVGSKQQVSNTSGLFAVLVVAEAMKNNFGLAARWDMLNGWANGDDHGLFSDGSEPTIPRWTPRPSFYYLYYFQKMNGDRLIPAAASPASTAVKCYATTFTSGEAGTALVNTSKTAQTVEIKFKNFRIGERYYWYSLQGSDDNGDFSRKVLVNGSGPAGVAGGPANYASLKAKSAITGNGIKVTVPPLGAVFLVVENK